MFTQKPVHECSQQPYSLKPQTGNNANVLQWPVVNHLGHVYRGTLLRSAGMEYRQEANLKSLGVAGLHQCNILEMATLERGSAA